MFAWRALILSVIRVLIDHPGHLPLEMMKIAKRLTISFSYRIFIEKEGSMKDWRISIVYRNDY
jgi:hypothetical protein